MTSSLPLLLFILLGLIGCKPPPCETDKPIPLQFLASSDAEVNQGDDGEAWPVFYYVFELSAKPPDAALKNPALLAEDLGLLGDTLLTAHERHAYPGKSESWTVTLAAKAEFVLVVTLYRRIVGDSWHYMSSVPEGHHQRVCDAKRRKEPPPPPSCVYLRFSGYEIRGGTFPPPGFDVSAFSTTCAPVLLKTPNKRDRKRRQR